MKYVVRVGAVSSVDIEVEAENEDAAYLEALGKWLDCEPEMEIVP